MNSTNYILRFRDIYLNKIDDKSIILKIEYLHNNYIEILLNFNINQVNPVFLSTDFENMGLFGNLLKELHQVIITKELEIYRNCINNYDLFA